MREGVIAYVASVADLRRPIDEQLGRSARFSLAGLPAGEPALTRVANLWPVRNTTHSLAFKVRVRDLLLLAEVGINPDEIGRLQPLIISVELALRGETPATLADTVDYRQIVQIAAQLAETRIGLIETFAAELAKKYLEWPAVTCARITIDKPSALEGAIAGVELTVAEPTGVSTGS